MPGSAFWFGYARRRPGTRNHDQPRAATERLALAFGAGAGLRIEEPAGQFRVTLALPYQTRLA